MELKIYNAENKEVGKHKLPPQFSELVRPDLIKRAVEAIQNNNRQQYGASLEAGKRPSVTLSRRRRKYKGSYGKGIARIPRKTMVRRGMQMIWVGAFSPGTVGGRRAHPAKPARVFGHKLNTKERRKAIRSALAATMNKDIVQQRGHKTPDTYPFLISTDFEKTQKTKDIFTALKTLGLEQDLERGGKKKIRPGKGTMRGRPYKRSKGPLLIVSGNCAALKAAKNIPGVDIIDINHVNTEHLAPGTHAGRLTLFTQAAIEKLEKDKLFM